MKKFKLIIVLLITPIILGLVPNIERKFLLWKDSDGNLVEMTQDCLYDSLKVEMIHAHIRAFERYYERTYITNGSRSKQRKLDFVRDIMYDAVTLYVLEGGTLPGAKIAQAGVESSWGRAKGVKYNNFFNIKSIKCNKHCTHDIPCHRLYDKVEKSNDMYRSFGSRYESFLHHNKLMKNRRYKKALKLSTSQEQLSSIRKSGYATLNYEAFMRMHGNIAKEFIILDSIAIELKERL